MINRNVLQNLQTNFFELLNSTSSMGNGANERSLKKSHNSILNGLRKIIIANEMSEKGIICISGLQGAGKTTLIKKFYGIDENILNVSLERGEKIPIFVCEKKDCLAIEMYAVILKYDGSEYSKEKVKLKAEEFKKFSTGESENLEIMYLELVVPYKHLKDESYCFMLLPGFEKKNDYWQTLVEFSVKCSDSSIFVFNESSFSKYDNQILLDKIKKNFGEKVIYVISHSDQTSDDNQEVRNTCMEVMGIQSDQDDRIVCSGEYDSVEQNQKWILNLKKAIDKYVNEISVMNKNCSDYIIDLIDNDIRPELINIKETIEDEESNIIYESIKNDEHLKVFDKTIGKLRKKLEEQIEEELSKACYNSIDRLEKLFSDKEYRKENSLLIFKNKIFGEDAIKGRQVAKDRLERALKSEDGNFEFNKAFKNAIDNTNQILISENQCRNLFLQESENKEKTLSLSSNFNKEKFESIIYDMEILLGKRDESNLNFRNQEINQTIKFIAELSVNFLAEHSLLYLNKIETETNLSSNIEENINIDFSDFQKALYRLGGLTSLDILEDGHINSFKTTVSNIGLLESIIPQIISCIGIGGIALGLTRDISKYINNVRRSEFESSKNNILSIKSEIKTKYINYYNNGMDNLRDQIEENLIKITGLNKSYYNRINSIITLNRINEELSRICKEVNEEKYEYRNVFR